MKFNINNIKSIRPISYVLKQFLLLFCLANIFILINDVKASSVSPTLIHQSFGDYVPGGLVHVSGKIEGITNEITALGVRINLPEGLNYEKQSVSDIWINERIVENEVEFVLSNVPKDNLIKFDYLLKASSELQGMLTIHAKMFYRVGNGSEENFETTPITIDSVAVNGFHHVSECLDSSTSSIQNNLFYQGNITALGVKLFVAENTQFLASEGATYETKQLDASTIELFWTTPPESPVEFSYLLSRTGIISDTAKIQSQLIYRIADGDQEVKNLFPNPIQFPQCEQFTIKATSSEGGIIKPAGLITVNRGDSLSFEMETDEGFKFNGWLVDGEIENAPFKKYVFNDIRADHRITAMFKQIEYQIKIVHNDDKGSIRSSTGSDTVLHGNDITFTITPKIGFEIDQIIKNNTDVTEILENGKVTFENVINNQQKLEVTYKQKIYEIQVTHDDNGNVVTSDGAFSVPHGQDKRFSFIPNDGFVIGEVRIDGQPITMFQNFYIFRNVTKNYSLDVSFDEPETFTITTQIDGTGNGKISPEGNILIERGASQTLIFTPGSDSIIDDIIVDGISKGPLQKYLFPFVIQNHAVTAKFAKKPTITITAESVNMTCGTIEPSGTITLSKGSNQTFQINPADECVIQDVQVDDVSEGKIHVYTFWNVQEDRSIKAFFEEKYITHKVEVTYSQGGTGKPAETLMVRDRDSIKLIPEPDEGFRIENVLANEQLIDPPYIITITEDVTIQVNFTPNVSEPVSDFSFTQISQIDPLRLSFKNQSSGFIQQWVWNFGDGYKSSAEHPLHDYYSPGTYTVSLTVTGPGGSATKNIDIEVIQKSPDPIKVMFLSTNTTGPVPFEAQFINQTQNKNNDVLSWLWDFGDGKTSSSEARAITHVYTKAGIYTVTLTAKTENATYSAQKQDYIKIDGRKIKGRVTAGDFHGDDTNDAFHGCTVEVHTMPKASQTPIFVDSVLTDANGEYTLTGLPATDNLVVSAWPPLNNNQYVGEYYLNKSDPLSAKKLSTKNDDLEINFVLTKLPQLGIKGQVTQNNNGLPEIEIIAFSISTFNIQSTISDQNGFYTFTHLIDAKDYRIYVWSDELNSDVYYSLPKEKTVGVDAPNSSSLSWDKARTISLKNGPVDLINIIIDNAKFDNISGIVQLKENGQPVKNIWVNAWSDDLNSGNGAITDQNGAYTIIGLSIDEGYIVEIDSSDPLYPYQAYNQRDNREDAEEVKPGNDQVHFYLKSGNTLFGHVYDSDGVPLNNVKITTWSLSKGTTNDTISDETGLYSIPNLPPLDDYIVCAFSEEYPIQYFFHKNKQKNADHVDLTDGDVYNINFTLDKGAVIEGTVWIINDQNQQEKAGEGIFINVWSSADESLSTEKTNSEGQYRFIGLNSEATLYTVYVWEKEYIRAFYSDNGTVHKWNEATGVQPGTIMEPKICDLILSKGYRIQGIVSTENKAIKNVKVEAWNLSNEFFADAVSTDEVSHGYNYALTGLPGNETYQISFTHDAYTDESIVITLTTENATEANCNLDLPGRNISGIIRNLEPGKSVFVQVSRKNKSIKMKEIVGTDTEPPYEVPYQFTGLKPKKNYMVDILQSAHYPYVAYKRINLKDDHQENINLVLATVTRSLQGRIFFPGNATIGDTVYVYARSEKLNKSERQTQVVYEGTGTTPYLIDRLEPSNDYIVSIQSDVYKQQYYDNVSSDQAAKRVDLTQDQTGIDFDLQKGASISGTVLDVKGEALSNIRVEAWSDSAEHLGVDQTNSNGHYSIGGLNLTDDYQVYIQYKQATFYYSTEKIVSNKKNATLVSTHQLAENIDFQIIDTGSISGIVKDSNNQRLENVIVTARSVSKDSKNACLTDQLGRYEINGLPMYDDYRVKATPDSETNYMSQVQTDISAGETNVNFSLLTGYTISGVVKSWTDEPIFEAKVEISSSDMEDPLVDYSDEDGYFQIGGITAGAYNFWVYAPNNSQLMDYSEASFVIDNNISEKMVTLAPASHIDGVVTLSESINNAPIADIMITIFSESQSFWTSVKTDQTGYFLFGNLPEATDYKIQNVSDHYLTQVKTNRATGETVNFSLEPAIVLKGMLINAQTGAGIDAALVQVYYKGLLRDETRSDRNGRFQASSLEHMINGNYAEYLVRAKYENFPDVQAIWTADQTDLLVLKMSRGDQNIISGIITENEIPPDEVDVFVRYYFEQDRKGYIGQIQCDINGAFMINGLNSDRQYHLKIVAKYKDRKKQFWLGANDAPVSKRREAKGVPSGTFSIQFQLNSAWQE